VLPGRGIEEREERRLRGPGDLGGSWPGRAGVQGAVRDRQDPLRRRGRVPYVGARPRERRPEERDGRVDARSRLRPPLARRPASSGAAVPSVTSTESSQ
jgi:hypothetical protein